MRSVISIIWNYQFWGIRDFPALQGNALQGNTLQGNALADFFSCHSSCVPGFKYKIARGGANAEESRELWSKGVLNESREGLHECTGTGSSLRYSGTANFGRGTE